MTISSSDRQADRSSYRQPACQPVSPFCFQSQTHGILLVKEFNAGCGKFAQTSNFVIVAMWATLLLALSSNTRIFFSYPLPQVGSPTAFANEDVNKRLRAAAERFSHTLYIPSGALWGANDILKLATAGKLKVRLKVLSHVVNFMSYPGTRGEDM